MRLSFLLCAYNEEKTIERTLRSILNQRVKPDEIIVVNDGSTDGTAEILKRFEDKCIIVNLPRNTGNKARAQRVGLGYVTGDLVAFTDADTELDPAFLENGLPYFLDPLVGGVSGQVLSKKKNWLTCVRQIQYLIGQDLYKRGMGVSNTIFVIPGCAGIVRRRLFHASFDTVTEDMDMTLRINERGYKILYAPNVKVYTTDPTNLSSYFRQITRWHSGYFQNLKKHFKPAPFRVKVQMILPFLEIALSLLGTILLIPSLIFSNLLLLFASLFEILVVEVFVLYGAMKLSRKDLLLHLPSYFLVRIVEVYVWLKCLVSELILHKHESRWLRADRI